MRSRRPRPTISSGCSPCEAAVSALDVTILGCGSSTGVPRIGGPDGAGDWGACDPANPKNRRRRCSILVRQRGEGGTTTVLVDTSPDLREQLLDAHCARLDGVLITHDHADQTHGLDDLRAVAFGMRRKIDLYSDRAMSRTSLKPSSATPSKRRLAETIRRSSTLTRSSPAVRFDIAGEGGALAILPLALQHGRIRSLGFRFGPFAYTPDVNALPEERSRRWRAWNAGLSMRCATRRHPTHAMSRPRSNGLRA